MDIQELIKEIYTESLPGDLECLSHFAHSVYRGNPECKIVEFGTLNGVSAMVMADRIRPPAEVITVDNYMSYQHRIGRRKMDRRNPQAILSHKQVCDLIAERGFADRVSVIKGDDLEWLGSCDNNSLDMLAVDSLHTYQHVSATLELALPKMKRNAIICGHDYTPMGQNVVYAVEDWRKKYKDFICGFAVHTLTWWCLVRKEVPT